jgi:hypothetical protein
VDVCASAPKLIILVKPSDEQTALNDVFAEYSKSIGILGGVSSTFHKSHTVASDRRKCARSELKQLLLTMSAHQMTMHKMECLDKGAVPVK